MFYLKRFLNAQESGGMYDNMSNYQTALQEIRNGHKRTHWIWYIFPQMKGLGKSEISQFYGINGREEAYAYIEHPHQPYIEGETRSFDSFDDFCFKKESHLLSFQKPSLL